MKKIVMASTLLAAFTAQATLVGFDSKGPVPGGFHKADGMWSDNGATFTMNVDPTYGSWNGITYSDVNDTTTADFSNGYAVYGDGMDRSDGGVYAISYVSSYNPPAITFGGAASVDGFYVNNGTYAALSMLQGDDFAKQFGGVSGHDEDWFKLSVEGKNAADASLGVVDFFLADYRFSDNAQDYIVEDWTWVDLSGLGDEVSSLSFALSSSDVGQWGMNTPAYFALDDLSYAIPEPGMISLLMCGSFGLILTRRCIRC